MAVLSELDRFHQVQDVNNRIPDLGNKRAHLKAYAVRTCQTQAIQRKYGLDMPEIFN